MKLATALIGTAALVMVPQFASAATKTTQNVSSCKTEIRTNLSDAASVDVEFKGVRGNSRLQTITFDVDADGQKDTITCKARRSEPVEIVWGETLKPEATQLVKAEEPAKVEASVEQGQ